MPRVTGTSGAAEPTDYTALPVHLTFSLIYKSRYYSTRQSKRRKKTLMWFATAINVVICTTWLGLTQLQISISKQTILPRNTCMVRNRKEKMYSFSDTHLELSSLKIKLSVSFKLQVCFTELPLQILLFPFQSCLPQHSRLQLRHLHPLAVTGRTHYLYLTYIHFQLQIYWGSLYQCIQKIIQK